MPGLFRRSQHPLAVDTSDLLDEDTFVDDEPSQPIIVPESEECIPQWVPLQNNDCIHSKSVAVALSIGMLVACMAISSGLGYYSVFVQKPPPVIDKSYDAFNIPNHKASIEYKKFNFAKKDLINWNRRKRDLRWADPSPEHQHSKFDIRADKLSSFHQQESDVDALNKDKNLKINSDKLKSKNGEQDGLQNFIKDIKNYKTVERTLIELNHGPLIDNNEKQLGHFSSQPHSTSRGSPGETFYAKHVKPHVDAWKDFSSMNWVERMVHRIKRSNHRHNIVYQQYPWKKMQVVYMAEGDEEKNIFTRDRLQTIHDIEYSIMNHPDFESYCLRDQYTSSLDASLQEYNGCAPLNSLLTYFYPSRNSDGVVHYDGLGSNLGDIDSALRLAMTHDSFYYYVDENINKTNPKSRLMRTEVLFGAPLRGYVTPYDHKEEQTDKYKKFVITYIDLLSKASTDKVLVLYGGNEIFDYEVDTSFWQDITLSLISLACILVLMFILTSFSVWLTFWGLASITLSFPIAFFFYRVVFGIRGLGIMNGAAVFVIIGIGVDDVFVFVNIFRQSQHILSMRSRIYHTMTTAGKATFFTSFTTAAAFAANVFSAIPAVHQFGLFMSLIVSCCWITVVVIMPSALYLWHICFRKCEMRCYAFCVPCNTSLDLPPGGAPISHQGETNRYRPLISEEPVDDDDVPMLQMEWPNDNNDVPLLMTGEDEDESSSRQPEVRTTESAYFGSILQSILYRWVALPVLRIRLIIIGFYVVIFFISVGLMTQLHPATKPPQLFRPDTNLQRFLDLKANLSIESLSCDPVLCTI